LRPVLLVLDRFIVRITFSFPPISFSHDRVAGRMVREFRLKIASGSPGLVQVHVVAGFGCLPNQAICSTIVIQRAVCSQQQSQQSQNYATHVFTIISASSKKKSPRLTPRGKVGWWRKSTYTT